MLKKLAKASRENLVAEFRDVDIEFADQIMRVIESDDALGLLEWCEAAQERDRECYARPPLMDLQAHAVNALLDGHGVESIGDRDEPHLLPDFHYINAGDLYSLTLIRDNSRDFNGTWLLGTVADVMGDAG